MAGGPGYVFFLGGRDLEMVTIRELIEREVPGRSRDANLAWGAKASNYRDEIEACLRRGETPVLVEMEDDLGVAPKSVVIVDHHGKKAMRDAPTSLHQIFRLLGLPPSRWTRWYELVAVNDRAYIPGLLAMGATREEIERVRAADRAAQGITPEDETQAGRAIAAAQTLCGGRLTVVRMSHSRLAAVEDRLHTALGGPGVSNLLLLSDDEVNFSGEGPVVLALNQRYPGGWFGGALPEQGFWGYSGSLDDVVAEAVSLLEP